MRARNGDAKRLDDLQTCDGTPLQSRGSRIYLSAGQQCFRYRHPLRNDAARRAIALADDVSLTSPSTWLWLPELAHDDFVRLELTLAPDQVASVPWPQSADGSYRIAASPRSSRAVAVFGRFRTPTLAVGGAQLTVALVDSLEAELDEHKTLAWLDAALSGVSEVYGRLPNPNVQIIVVPSGRASRSRSPVPFGHVIRDGGETVQFFVDAGQPLANYLRDWTADHEFAHLLLPYVDGEQKWISEGFGSYYQNVLQARRGAYTEQQAWQRLHRSFKRPIRLRPTGRERGRFGRCA